jgi:aminoglycoside phosphotransferase (APT) family kinase protein
MPQIAIRHPIYLARGGVPVPQVYLYCGTPNNPVRAEWIIMEYMPGKLFGDCIECLTDEQKRRTGADLAGIMSALFQITAPQCGSLLSLPKSGQA